MNTKTVSIIGAGLGGIAAAISARNSGYSVTLFEKNDKIGEKLNVVRKEGFSFDMGPSILTLPHVFESLFTVSGKKMSDYVEIIPVDIHWRNFFEDGSTIDLLPTVDATADSFEKLIKGSGSEFRKFIAYAEKQYSVIDKHYFKDGLDTFFSFFKAYSLKEILFDIDIFRSMSSSVEKYFSDKRLQDIFNYFIKYVGSSANDSPGFMNLMPYLHYGFGLWYVRGGMYEMAKAFEKLMCELGITIRCNTEVVEIATSENKVTTLKLSDGSEHPTDICISNMEVIPTYTKLLHEKKSFLKKYDKFEPACSGLVMHLGVDRVYPMLAHHNFFYSHNQKHHFNRVFRQHLLPDDPTIYLVAPTRTDPTQAPKGCDVIKILPHIPYLSEENPVSNTEYDNLKDLVLNKLERMGLKDLRKATIVQETLLPKDIERMYYSNKGSVYGVVCDRFKNFALKCPKKSELYDNLFFVGGSVNPGSGMPMALLSGINAVKLIQETTER